MDESRQVDELNYKDWTFRSRLPSSVDVGQCSRIGESQCSDSALDSEVSMFLQIVSSMGWCRSLQGVDVSCVFLQGKLEKLKSLCSLSRLYVVSGEEAGETASSTRDQGRVLSTENQADSRGILDSTGQDSSEDARRSWHDEGRLDSVASAVKDRNASRRRPVSTSTFSRLVLKIWICGWSGDARDPATAHLPTVPVETTHPCFEAEVSSTAVMSMFEVSRSMSVSRDGAVPADPRSCLCALKQCRQETFQRSWCHWRASVRRFTKRSKPRGPTQ